jgi:hypothetical protein
VLRSLDKTNHPRTAVYAVIAHRTTLFWWFLGSCTILAPNVLAQSKIATPSPFAGNPASSAYLLNDSAALMVSPLAINDVKVRYIGSEVITKKEDSPLNLSEFQMGLAWKLSKRMTLGIAEILPPVTVEKDIKDIPVVILNSVNLVDLGLAAHVKYSASVYGSYLVDDRLAFGTAVSTRKIDIKATAHSTSGEQLLNGRFSLETTSIVFGLSAVLGPQRVRLGLATSVLSTNNLSTRIETPLQAEGHSAAGGKTTRSSQAFSDVGLGIELTPNQKSTWGTDLQWRRADKNQKDFSLVDLTEKQKDVHDTVSVAVMSRYRSSERESVSAGFSYEPSPIGAGSKGASGTSGFGMRETVMLYSGYGDLLPAWTIALGLQYGAETANRPLAATSTRSKHSQSRSMEESQRLNQRGFVDRLSFNVGVRYRRASLGIDEKGELPGAYSQTKISFPISVMTNF